MEVCHTDIENVPSFSEFFKVDICQRAKPEIKQRKNKALQILPLFVNEICCCQRLRKAMKIFVQFSRFSPHNIVNSTTSSVSSNGGKEFVRCSNSSGTSDR